MLELEAEDVKEMDKNEQEGNFLEFALVYLARDRQVMKLQPPQIAFLLKIEPLDEFHLIEGMPFRLRP